MNAKSDFDLGVLNVGVVNVLVSLSLSWGVAWCALISVST